MPYLNISASSGRGPAFDGAPDQGLLREKGGRGFPYCAILDTDGSVLWEARPTSAEAIKEAMTEAKALAALKAKAAADPDNAALAASVKLLAVHGMGQRAKPPFEELEKAAATEGVDAKLLERFADVKAEMEFDAFMSGVQKEAGRDRAKANKLVYAAWAEGRRPPASSARLQVNFFYSAAHGAVEAGKAEHATELVKALETAAPKAGIPADRLAPAVKELNEKIAALN